MLSFRKKIFTTYLFVFLAFIAMMFPFAQKTVKNIVQKSMNDRASAILEKIRRAPNDDALIADLKEQKQLIFFRVSLISNERKILYDSHTKRLLGPRFSQEFVVSHPEVLQAFEEGTGYHEEYSEILAQDFAYFAKTFDFHGKTYVLRIAFPLQYVEEITKDFEFGFLGSGIVILMLFSMMTWFIINYLTRPIQQIIQAVKPYQEGITTTVPKIQLGPENRDDEFGQLADTLNSLSVKIRHQIESLTIERNEKEAVLESLVEGVVAVDNNMVVTFANAIALKLLNLSPDQILNAHADDLGQEKCTHLLTQCQKAGKILNDTLEIKRNKERRFLDLVAAPKRDGTGAILVLQDTSERFKLSEMRKDFVANASHELKTPITIIQGFAEALHDNPELPLETSSEILAKILRNCHKMSNLIKDLLTLTDIEHITESRLIDCNMSEILETVKDTVQDAYPDAEIEIIDHKGSSRLLADPNLIELALINLVENAAKYSMGPPKITLLLESFKNEIVITIKDEGVGIPKEELENIFQRFYRVDKSRSKRVGGSGLGLSIVETIVAKHHGKVAVDSEEGIGSTFRLTLPRKR